VVGYSHGLRRGFPSRWFSKYAHFIAVGHPYTAISVARVFFDKIVRLHGLLCSIVSDRDPVFTSKLWTELFSLAGVKLRLSSVFRPQTDGQSEVTNRILGVYLHCLAGDRPRSWLRWLPWAEYCYNLLYQSALQTTLFQVVYGRPPPTMLSYEPGVARVVALDRQLQERDTFLADIRERLLQAQDYMKEYHNKTHRHVEFEVGEWAWLRLHQRAAASIKGGTSSKLSPRYYGPFQFMERVGAVAYRLKLPAKSRLHDVFHVVFLKKYTSSSPATSVPLPPVVHGARFLHQLRFSALAHLVLRGTCSSSGRVSPMPTRPGSRWSSSRSRSLISSLRTSCFHTGREVLWTCSSATSSNGARRRTHLLVAKIFCPDL